MRERKNRDNGNEGEKRLMQDNEKTTQLIATPQSKKYMQEESDVTQLTVWKKPCETLNEETDRSMSLIDSTARDLHSCMRGLFQANLGSETMNLDSDRVLTAVQVARGINELMKTKIDAIRLYNDISTEVVDSVETEGTES